MKVRIPIRFDENTKLDSSEYIFHFKSLIIANIDVIETALFLVKNRIFNIYDYTIQTFEYKTYYLHNKKFFELPLRITKKSGQAQSFYTSSTQPQLAPALTVAIILSLLGLAGYILKEILVKVEKVIDVSPKLSFPILATALLIWSLKKK